MPGEFLTREGSLGATVDTWVNLSTLGSESAPPSLKMPPGRNKIDFLLFSIGDNTPTGAAIGTNIVVRIRGGLRDTDQQEFAVDGYNAIWATAGATGAASHMYKKVVDLDVIAGKDFFIDACATGGVCAGSPEVGVSVHFV